jgi:hypothetical protein
MSGERCMSVRDVMITGHGIRKKDETKRQRERDLLGKLEPETWNSTRKKKATWHALKSRKEEQ